MQITYKLVEDGADWNVIDLGIDPETEVDLMLDLLVDELVASNQLDVCDQAFQLKVKLPKTEATTHTIEMALSYHINILR